jgi:hypothetical protein
MAKHRQTQLEEVHYEITVGIPSGRSPPPGFGIITRRTVAVPPDRDPNPVREFGCWTAALNHAVETL